MHGALKGAWNSDVEVKRITTQVVDEVGKFLRYSDRFQQRFAARARHDILQVVEKIFLCAATVWEPREHV